MEEYPCPTVGALIFNPKGEILLVRSHKWKGKLVVPGGKVKLGERLEEALKREIKEETGLDIHSIEFLCFQEFIFGPEFWERRHFLFFDFVCKTDSYDVKLNEEAEGFVWLKPEEALIKEDVEPYTKRMIETYLKKVKK